LKLRIIHSPARHVFARYLKSSRLDVLNDGGHVPFDASFGWLAANLSMIEFDVLHLHTAELANTEDFQSVLDFLARCRKGLVVTLHEHNPLFSRDRSEFASRLDKLREYGAVFSTLTAEARERISELYSIEKTKISVIPHGNVLALDSEIWNSDVDLKADFTFSIHGGFRPNKRIFDAAVNLRFSPKLRQCTLGILTRAVSSIEFDQNSDLRNVLGLIDQDQLILNMRPDISDRDVWKFCRASSVMLLPYAWGSHSGQIELAADLCMPVVASNVGFYNAQLMMHKHRSMQPYWVDWSDGFEFQYGARFLSAMEDSVEMVSYVGLRGRRQMLDFRISERAEILSSYGDLYEMSLTNR
jgi:glycosyltransferase involved in cell wall biosynthesis